MPLRDIFKINRKTFFNPTLWIDYDSLREQNLTIWNSIKDLVRPEQPLHTETFEEAMKRLDLTEKDVQEGATRYRVFAIIFAVFGTLTFAYSFYLLFRYFTFTGWLLGLSAAGLFFGQAFRFDFWSFQMRSRKLGVTFGEWKKHILGDNKGSQK